MGVFNFSEFPVNLNIPELEGESNVLIYSAARRWKGPEWDLTSVINLSADDEIRLSPYSFLLLEQIQST